MIHRLLGTFLKQLYHLFFIFISKLGSKLRSRGWVTNFLFVSNGIFLILANGEETRQKSWHLLILPLLVLTDLHILI
jgi:hypothetical protein